jgi:ketosteroid isomerase-like protein
VTPRDVTDPDVRDLIRRIEEATSVFIRGDMRRYVELVPRADDYTLMAPSGGEPRRGFDGSDDALDALEQFFRGGEAELDIFETYASGDIAVLVAIERQHGEVGGLPDQDWSLRVTQVFRREGSEWRLVHRHADPLVREISHEHVGALARGEASAK